MSLGLPHLSAEAVAAHADGMLPRAAAGRAERHLAACAECRAAVQEQREAVLALRLAPPPGLPSGLLERLRTLPERTPLGTPPLALSPEGQPLFAAYAGPAGRAGHRSRNLGMFAIAALVVTAGTVAASAAATPGGTAGNPSPGVPAARTVQTQLPVSGGLTPMPVRLGSAVSGQYGR